MIICYKKIKESKMIILLNKTIACYSHINSIVIKQRLLVEFLLENLLLCNISRLKYYYNIIEFLYLLTYQPQTLLSLFLNPIKLVQVIFVL